MTWNHFDSLQRASTSGLEDFLTASLVSLMEGLPEVKRQFLKWLEPHVHIPLDPDAHWRARGQEQRTTSRFGQAIIDMVLVNGTTELWFEHKVDAPEGERRATDASAEIIGQLEKYNRHARPEYEAGGEGRIVLLFAIAKTSGKFDLGRIGDLHNTGDRGGYVVPCTGHSPNFVWMDLYPHLRAALEERRSMSADRFETMLLADFLGWWESLDGLTPARVSPTLYAEDKGERGADFEPLAAWLHRVLRAGEKITTSKGAAIYSNDPGDQVWNYLAIAPKNPFEIKGWNPQTNGANVLEVSLRFVEEPWRSYPGEPQWMPCNDRPLMLTRERDTQKKGTWLRAYVGLVKWEDRLDAKAQASEVQKATLCAIRAIENVTTVSLMNDGF